METPGRIPACTYSRVLAIDRAGPGVRPHSVADLIALNDVDGVRKIRHAASMIEVQVRIEHVAHVLWLYSQFLQLGVNSVLTLECVRTKGGGDVCAPIGVSPVRIRNHTIDACIPQHNAIGRMDDHGSG